MRLQDVHRPTAIPASGLQKIRASTRLNASLKPARIEDLLFHYTRCSLLFPTLPSVIEQVVECPVGEFDPNLLTQTLQLFIALGFVGALISICFYHFFWRRGRRSSSSESTHQPVSAVRIRPCNIHDTTYTNTLSLPADTTALSGVHYSLTLSSPHVAGRDAFAFRSALGHSLELSPPCRCQCRGCVCVRNTWRDS